MRLLLEPFPMAPGVRSSFQGGMHGDGCLTALSPADGDRQDKGIPPPSR